MKPAEIDESSLKKQLLVKGYSFLKITHHLNDNGLEVEANKLQPIAMEKDNPLFIPLPVLLNITLTNKSQIKQITEHEPTPTAVEGAKKFVNTLIENKQISGFEGNIEKSATHQVETDDKGNKVIKRNKFSAF